MVWLLLRELFFEFAGQLMDVRGLAESLNLLGCGFHVDARVLAELLQHLEHHGELLLGEHADLKIEMGAPLRLASHAILADQHANGQENTLGGDEKCQNAEWERIERSNAGNQTEIHGTPDSDQDYVQHEEFYASDEFYDGIAVAFGTRAAIEGFLFDLGNGGNIELRGIFRDLVRNSFIHAMHPSLIGLDIPIHNRQMTEYIKI
jgi:hypothetical protein